MYAGFNLIKPALIVLLCAALFGGGMYVGTVRVYGLWNADKAAQLAADQHAIFQQVKENERRAEQDALNNQQLKARHDKELAAVRRDLAASRLRLGPSFDRTPQTTTAPGAAGSAATDTGSRLVPEAVARRIRELIDETERVAATARACQRYVRETSK